QDFGCNDGKGAACWRLLVLAPNEEMDFGNACFDPPDFRYAERCVDREPVDRSASMVDFYNEIGWRIGFQIQVLKANDAIGILHIERVIRLRSFGAHLALE